MKAEITEVSKEVVQVVRTRVIRIDLDHAEAISLMDFLGMAIDSNTIFWNADKRLAQQLQDLLVAEVEKL